MHNAFHLTERNYGRTWASRSVQRTEFKKNAAIIYDGEGGIIAVWRDERDIYGDLYMQRIHADGTFAWKKDGIPLCTVGGHQDRPFIVRTTENQFFIAWLDYRGNFGEKRVDAIYCQQIDLRRKSFVGRRWRAYFYKCRRTFSTVCRICWE